jgi:hypothetical protein
LMSYFITWPFFTTMFVKPSPIMYGFTVRSETFRYSDFLCGKSHHIHDLWGSIIELKFQYQWKKVLHYHVNNLQFLKLLWHGDLLLGNNISIEIDSWKPTHYGMKFPWIRMINKHFLGYEMKDIFSVSPSQHYITGANQIRPNQKREKSDQTREWVKSEWSESYAVIYCVIAIYCDYEWSYREWSINPIIQSEPRYY